MINQKKVSPVIAMNSSTVMEKEIGKRFESSLIIGDTMTVHDEAINNPLRISHNTQTAYGTTIAPDLQTETEKSQY